MVETKDVMIIGAGPGGIAAAIYLKRADFSPLLLDSRGAGGLMINANLVENYPGFQGVRGVELAKRFAEHLDSLNIPVVKARAERVRRTGRIFEITTNGGKYHSHAVIIATGTRPRKIRIKGAKALEGVKVFYDLEQVISLKAMERVLVVGGGDIAFDFAISLREAGKEATIICRSASKCLPLLRRRAEAKGIEILEEHRPLEIIKQGNAITLTCQFQGEMKYLYGDKILMACGRIPEISILDPSLRRRIIRKTPPATGIKGLYLVGDVNRKNWRQIGIAVGDGIMAAMMADRYLKRKVGK